MFVVPSATQDAEPISVQAIQPEDSIMPNPALGFDMVPSKAADSEESRDTTSSPMSFDSVLQGMRTRSVEPGEMISSPVLSDLSYFPSPEPSFNPDEVYVAGQDTTNESKANAGEVPSFSDSGDLLPAQQFEQDILDLAYHKSEFGKYKLWTRTSSDGLLENPRGKEHRVRVTLEVLTIPV